MTEAGAELVNSWFVVQSTVQLAAIREPLEQIAGAMDRMDRTGADVGNLENRIKKAKKRSGGMPGDGDWGQTVRIQDRCENPPP